MRTIIELPDSHAPSEHEVFGMWKKRREDGKRYQVRLRCEWRR